MPATSSPQDVLYSNFIMETIKGSVEMIFFVILLMSFLLVVTTIVWAIARWSERSASREFRKILDYQIHSRDKVLVNEIKDILEQNLKITEEKIEDKFQLSLDSVSEEQTEHFKKIEEEIHNENLQLREIRGNENSTEEIVNIIPKEPSEKQDIKTKTSIKNQEKANQLFKEGHLDLENGDFNSAIEKYTESINLNPYFAEAHNARGIAYRKINQPHKALDDYTLAIKIDPSLAAAFNNRGVVHSQISLHESAVSDFNEAINIDDENPFAYCNRAMSYNHLYKFDEAIEDATKAIEKDITLAEAYVSRGIAKFLSKDEIAAQEDFEYSKKLGYDPIEIQNKLNTIIKNLPSENDS
ncbi:MAG: hypothetical protein CL758_03800 [Chloroflexi bacterium]|nr:hypothetical protein [Chloroflexota bacterium]|tara:strand:+ start:9937 stop:11001 length:1065 start_codon:yes stop_codon:yes gene_type:complete